MTDKLISHLKNMNQVAGKFTFLKPELYIWYGIVVNVRWIEFKTALPVSVCELPALSMVQATTTTYRHFELVFIHCTCIML